MPSRLPTPDYPIVKNPGRTPDGLGSGSKTVPRGLFRTKSSKAMKYKIERDGPGFAITRPKIRRGKEVHEPLKWFGRLDQALTTLLDICVLDELPQAAGVSELSEALAKAKNEILSKLDPVT